MTGKEKREACRMINNLIAADKKTAQCNELRSVLTRGHHAEVDFFTGSGGFALAFFYNFEGGEAYCKQ